MKQVLLCLILFFCCGAIQSQTIFNPNDVIVNYNSGAASGSSANPNIPWGLNITRWVRTPKMSWNTDRYKCYMIGNVPFRLRYPDTYVPGVNDGKKYPIMLFWHGGGEANPNTYDNEFQLFNGGQTFPQKITDGGQDAFILFPQSRNSGWDNSYFTLMNVVIDSLIKNCKGDEDRVLSMGLSIGGTASFDYALAYPKRASTIIANSPVFIDTYNSSFGPAVHIPLWLGSGGQDINPTPAAVQNFVNAYNNTGGNLYWSFYPTRGHVMWDYQWAEEPNYGDRMRTTHKANPLVYFNNRFFCPGSPVSARLGITPGFFSYQWDKNGTTIAGALSNEYIATDFGTYRARFKRTSASDWSAWSLAPAVISPVCPSVAGNGTGLKGTYYNNINVTPPSVLTRTDAALNFIWDENVSPGSPVAGQNFSIKWTGKIQPQFSETYTIYTRTDDGVRLWINGVQLINNYTDHASTEDFGSITLVGGQKYDIRIEYYNKGGGGLAYLKWSSPSTVKQMIPTKQLYPDGTGDPDVPLCATNTQPANGAVTATSTTAVLSWSNVLNATSYDVYVWTGATPPASPTADNVTTNTYNASGLTASALYNWYVVPKNAGGSATGCITNNKTTFTTAGIPACTVNTLPANASTIATATTAALSWGAVVNTTSYDVYLWTGATPPASPTATNIITNTFNATNLIGSTLYNWYIVPKNASGPAAGCDAFNKTTFTTGPVTPVPGCTINGSPANGSAIATQTTADLVWAPVAAATSYDVYIWTGLTPPASPTTNTTTALNTVSGLAPSTLYNWYIAPRNATGAATICGSINATAFTTAAVVIPVPGCTSNTSPLNGTTIATQSTATLTWNIVAAASSYDVYLWTGATAPVSPTATNVSGNIYNATGLSAAALYNWYVVPKNASGPATGCDLNNKTTFTTAVTVPACATNTAPLNGITIATQSTATLSWNTVATAASYDVYLWTGAAPPVSPTATDITTTTYNATGLTASSLYNWYVVPKNVSGAATGCDPGNKTTFTTAAPVPQCADNLLPANGAALATQTSVTLSWNSAATATSYDVYLWKGAIPPASPTATVPGTAFGTSGLDGGTLYNWYVVPKNANGPATGCDLSNKSTFTTATTAVPPACAINISPASGAMSGSPTNVTLTWGAVPGATSYDVYLWIGATPPASPTNTVSIPTYSTGGLTAATLYSWYVVPKNAGGAAIGCTTSATVFTTASVAVPVPGCANSISPVNNSTIETQNLVTLTWDPVASATSYDVYISGGATALTFTNTTSTTVSFGGLFASTLYTWYVIPKNAGGSAVGCDVSNKSSFTTAAIPVPACVTNIAPANGAILLSQTTATLSWPLSSTATSYDVYLWTGATQPASPTANVTGTSYNATNLIPAGLYSWYIAPRNVSGAATICGSTNATAFTTAAIPVPVCTSNTAPVNGSTILTQATATLNWNTVAAATSYDVYLWTGALPPASPIASNVTGNTYNATSLAAATIYNWYVVPKNAAGSATGCSSTNKSTFTTAAVVIPAPACVTISAPANGAAIATQTTATLTWNAAATATSYDVYIWSGAVAPVTPTANITGTSYNAISLIADTLYNWYIAPKNASGAASGCATTNRTSFTTASSTPAPGAGTGLQGVYYNGITLTGTPLLTRIDPVINFDSYGSPGPGVPADQYSVRWTGQVKPLYTETYTFYTTADDGIRLWINGTQLVNNFVAQGATERSGTIAMVAGQKYDIIIEYFEGSGGAVSRLSWSGARTPKAVIPQSQLFPPGFVDPTIPTCAANTAPANGSTIASASAATLAWNAVPDASSYDVYIWTGATAPVTPTANTTYAGYNATALTAATLYNWYVVPKNVIGAPTGCISNSTTFNTGVPPPACTVNLLPINNAILATSSTAAFTWTAAATATSYDVYIWTGATAPATPTVNVTAASYNAAGLTPATTYNWYVSPRNASGAAIGCSTNKTAFVTAAPPAPSCTVNTLPANGVTIATQITAALSWNPAPNATSYDVYVWTGATPPASPTTNVTASTYAASGLIAATSYNWYVTPKNATGTAAGCNVNASSFTTAAAPPSNLLGYVKVSTDPYTACADASSTGRTAVYGTSIANGSVLYTGPALTTAFNGGWNWYSFTPVPGGPVTVTFAVYPTGGILMLRTCANGGARIAAAVNATTVEQDIAALKVIRETAETVAPRRPAITAVVTGNVVYPNPVVNGQSARLQINSDKTGVAVVNIVNSNGFIISTRKVNLVAGMNAATVNTASLGKGLYIVNITGGTKATNVKLLVE